MKFLTLAVSYKYGGLCVAGLNLDTLEYVRIGYPSGNECAAIPSGEFRYKTMGGEIQLKVLDVIDITAEKMVDNGCQTENYSLRSINGYDGPYTIEQIAAIYRDLEKDNYIYLNSFDYVGIKHIDDVNYSLQFVKVENFTITQYTDLKGNHKLHASFNYNGRRYCNIRVTDSVFSAYPNCYGNNQILCSNCNAYIMVSLPYDQWSINFGKFYKYVSGIILV